MKTNMRDQFGHARTVYIINNYLIMPAKHFGHKARSDYNKWAISNGYFIEAYKPNLKEAKNYCNTKTNEHHHA